jgi:hypothetical protein
MNTFTIEEAKTRIRIPELWRRHQLPGVPSKSCYCPFHHDSNKSFSVFNDGQTWNCFAGCGGGDAIDFLARACRLSRRASCRIFLEMAGCRLLPRPRPVSYKSERPQLSNTPTFPAFGTGTSAEIQALATLRRISPEGLQWASERGVLRFATIHRYGVRSWIVTDLERINAQARRLDGQNWQHLGGSKAWTLRGSCAAWPLGIREAIDFPSIALCEGGPDFLAAHYIALWEQSSHHTKHNPQCAPVAMLGASQRIHIKALPLFAGKRVRIFCHTDEAGQKSARRWAEQLAAVGVIADAFDFSGLKRADGMPAKDLNDCLLLNADGFRQTERILP